MIKIPGRDPAVHSESSFQRGLESSGAECILASILRAFGKHETWIHLRREILPVTKTPPCFQKSNTLLPLIHGNLYVSVETGQAIMRSLPHELIFCHAVLHQKCWKELNDQYLATAI